MCAGAVGPAKAHSMKTYHLVSLCHHVLIYTSHWRPLPRITISFGRPRLEELTPALVGCAGDTLPLPHTAPPLPPMKVTLVSVRAGNGPLKATVDAINKARTEMHRAKNGRHQMAIFECRKVSEMPEAMPKGNCYEHQRESKTFMKRNAYNAREIMRIW